MPGTQTTQMTRVRGGQGVVRRRPYRGRPPGVGQVLRDQLPQPPGRRVSLAKARCPVSPKWGLVREGRAPWIPTATPGRSRLSPGNTGPLSSPPSPASPGSPLPPPLPQRLSAAGHRAHGRHQEAARVGRGMGGGGHTGGAQPGSRSHLSRTPLSGLGSQVEAAEGAGLSPAEASGGTQEMTFRGEQLTAVHFTMTQYNRVWACPFNSMHIPASAAEEPPCISSIPAISTELHPAASPK